MTDADRAILDKLDPEQIEAYLKQRKREAWLAHGCGDGFERLLVERDLGSIILREGCWVWRDDTNTIRRAFGWCSAPAWGHDRMCWVTFDDEERMIAFGRWSSIPSSLPMDERVIRNLAWLADVRVWLLAQPVERTG
jgi:hypothetical protein